MSGVFPAKSIYVFKVHLLLHLVSVFFGKEGSQLLRPIRARAKEGIVTNNVIVLDCPRAERQTHQARLLVLVDP